VIKVEGQTVFQRTKPSLDGIEMITAYPSIRRNLPLPAEIRRLDQVYLTANDLPLLAPAQTCPQIVLQIQHDSCVGGP